MSLATDRPCDSIALLAAGAAPAGDAIRQLTILSRPQAGQPQEYQSIQPMVQEWNKLGLDIEVKVQPWEQMSDFVWDERDKWDMTGWQMAWPSGTLDPDELALQSVPFEHGHGRLQFRRLPQPRL